MEKKLLQCAIALACIVPICAGASGVLLGNHWLSTENAIDMDSHFRYLSGLLLGIGLCFASLIPRIERHEKAALILTMIVFTGGLARLLSLLETGVPSMPMLLGLGMELVVTPCIYLWIRRIARTKATIA